MNEFLKQKYKDAYQLFVRSKASMYLGLGIFLFTILFGFIFPGFFEEQIFELIQEMIAQLEGKNAYEITTFIFFNNVKASLMAMILGIFVGVGPILITVINGYVIGFTSNLAVSSHGILVLWRLIPHGIFEIPAIILSVGTGIYLGSRFLKERFAIREENTRLLIISIISILLGLIIMITYSSLGSYSSGEELSTLISSGNIGQIFMITVFNLMMMFCFVYIVYSFVKEKKLRKELVDAIWFFILIIIPLLLIAGIIEGVLVYLLA